MGELIKPDNELITPDLSLIKPEHISLENWASMSLFSQLLHTDQLDAFRESLSEASLAAIPYQDDFWLRPNQIIPVEDQYKIILMMCGRGWGKTRAGSAWIKQQLFVEGCEHVALVARTHSEAVGIILKEDSGIMNSFPPDLKPHWSAQERVLTWEEHGKKATVIYGNEPEQARGYNFDAAWIDEFAKYQDPGKLWDLLLAALRKRRADGKRAPALFTTTPTPDPTLHEFYRWWKDPTIEPEMPVKIIAGSSRQNRDNLAPGFVEALEARYKRGSRQYRQEVEGELLFDIEGAIFTRDMFQAWMPPLQTVQDGWITDKEGVEHPHMVPALDGSGLQIIDWNQTLAMFSRIVVGVDPSGARDKHSSGDLIGIIVAGLLREAAQPTVVVLWDGSFKDAPSVWGRRVVDYYHRFQCNEVVAEENFGGGMVENTIKAEARAGEKIPYTDLRASRGKDARAEEIAQWYASGQVLHLYHLDETRNPVLAAVEEQMCQMTAKDYLGPERSPDRADALIWATRCLLRQPEIKKTFSSSFIRRAIGRS